MSNAKTLYETLFETLQGVKTGAISIEKAKAMSEISQTIINAAKAEIDYARVTQQHNKSVFFDMQLTKALEKKPDIDDTKTPATYTIGTGIVERNGHVTTHTTK